MRRRAKVPETISIFAVGIAVGAALGVLFAPKSGEETQEFIADRAREKFDTAISKGKEWAKMAQATVDDVREHIMEAANAGERTFNEGRRI